MRPMQLFVTVSTVVLSAIALVILVVSGPVAEAVGNAIGVGDTWGPVAVDGGSVANLTDIGVSANGGTAIADASGGDYNLAFVS